MCKQQSATTSSESNNSSYSDSTSTNRPISSPVTLQEELNSIDDIQTKYLVAFQRFLGLSQIRSFDKNGNVISTQIKVKYPLLKSLFTVASMAGEDIFFLMPILMWVSIPLGGTFALNFGVALTITQMLKDVFQIPRPDHSSVIKLEKHFETEYGFPSTHTVSGMLPLAVLLKIYRQTPEAIHPKW